MRGLKRVLNFVGLCLFALVVLLLLVRLLLPSVGVRIGNRLLSRVLRSEVNLGDLDLSVVRGSILFRGLRVSGLEGFSDRDVLSAGEVFVKVRMGSIVHMPFTIEEVRLGKVDVRIERNQRGRWNIEAIVDNAVSYFSRENEAVEGKVEDPPEEEPEEGFMLVFEKVLLQDLCASYEDHAFSGRPLTASLERLGIEIENFWLDTSLKRFENLTAGTGDPGLSGDPSSGLTRASLKLDNIKVGQPDGFGQEALISLSGLRVEASMSESFHPPITVDTLAMETPEINLARNRSAELNLEVLVAGLIHSSSSERENQAPKPNKLKQEIPAPAIPIYLKTLHLGDLAFTYSDRSFQEEPLVLKLGDLDLGAADLLFDTSFASFKNLLLRKPKGEKGEAEPQYTRLALDFRDLRLDQPMSHGEGSLFSVSEFQTRVRVPRSFHPPVTIESLTMKKGEVHLVQDPQGVMNTDVVINKAVPGASSSTGEKKTEPNYKRKDKHEIAVHLERFHLQDFAFSFEALTQEGDKFLYRINGIEIVADKLIYDPSRSGQRVLPGTFQLTCHLEQKEPLQHAPLGVFAKVGILSNGVPALNLASRDAGIELETFGPLVPVGTANVIGGDALDLAVDLELGPALLDCDVRVSPSGSKPLTLHIGGTPSKPDFDESSILFPVLLRTGGLVGSVVGNLSGAGRELSGTAVDTTMALGRGAVDVAGTGGKGILRTLKGVAAGDIKEISRGLGDTTIGTVSSGTEAVTDTGKTAMKGTVDAGSASLGNKALEKWREKTTKRWEKNWEKAMKKVEKMPYPEP